MFETLLIAVQVGLLYVPLILGIYVTLGVLSLPDFTVQGSFGIGGAVCAVTLLAGADSWVAILCGAIGGGITGLVTAILHLWLRMNVLLASILVAAAAFSVALAIMGSGNLSLIGSPTIFDGLQAWGVSKQGATIVMGAFIAIVLSLVLVRFLNTTYGVSLTATGQSIQTARGLGIRTETRQVAGLFLGNALAAVTGGLIVQSQRFMDVTMQNGIIVAGLAGLMVGLSIIRSIKPLYVVAGLVIGVIAYRFIVALVLSFGASPNMVQLITAALVVIVVWLRTSAAGLPRLLTKPGRRDLRADQSRYYEEDRVASFF